VSTQLQLTDISIYPYLNEIIYIFVSPNFYSNKEEKLLAETSFLFREETMNKVQLYSFLLHDSVAYEIYVPTFRNLLFLTSSLVVYEVGTQCSETSGNKIQTWGITQKKMNTKFRTRQHFEIKKV
jgi:hypothetical protein